MTYVDGFVIAVKKNGVADYKRISKQAGKIWKEHGALSYVECVIDDTNMKFGMPFPKLAQTKPSETVVFSWITYKNKAQRNRVSALVMKDPRMDKMAKEMAKKMPFDMKRMSYGGFKAIVEM